MDVDSNGITDGVDIQFVRMVLISKYRWLTKAEVLVGDGCDVEVRAALFAKDSTPVVVDPLRRTVEARLEIKTVKKVPKKDKLSECN